MKKKLFLGFALLLSSGAFAGTEHYVRRDGNHVQHLKITQSEDEIRVGMDVNFEPNAGETGQSACSAEISGHAKKSGDSEITLKKQAEGEAHYCALTIKLSNDGAMVEQSPGCAYFAAGICHFGSDGKDLARVK